MTSNYSFCVMKTLTPIIGALHRANALCNIIGPPFTHPSLLLPPPLPSLGCRGRRLLNNIICNGWSDGTTGLAKWVSRGKHFMAEGCFFFLFFFFLFAQIYRVLAGLLTAGPGDIRAIRSSDYHSKCLRCFSLTLSSVRRGVAMATQT